MGDWIVYSIKSAIVLSGLFACYKLALGRLDAPGLRRGVLLAILVFSLVLPFCHISFQSPHVERIPLYIPEITVVSEPVVPSFDIWQFVYSLLGVVIVMGTGVFIIKTILSFLTLLYYRLKGEERIVNGKSVTLIKERIDTPFCFMGRIYLGSEDLEGPSDMLIAHEESHITHMHFVDLLIGRIVAILQWWNPFVWIMMREMQMVHEFQADSDVLASGFSRKEYQYYLLGRSMGKGMLLNVNGLGHGGLKQRLIMLNRNSNSKMGKLAAIFLIPLAVGFVALFSLPGMSAVFLPFETLSVKGMFDAVNAGSTTDNFNIDNSNLASVYIDVDMVGMGNDTTAVSVEMAVAENNTVNRKEKAKVPEKRINRKVAEVLKNQNSEEENVEPYTPDGVDVDLNESKKEVPKIILNHIKGDKQPAVFINGKREPYERFLDIDPNKIEAIAVRKNDPENYPNGCMDVKLKVNILDGKPAVFVNGERVMYDMLNSIDRKKIKSITVNKNNHEEYPLGRIDVVMSE